MNQFSVPEAREILNSKILLSLVSYIFSDGPWRDTLVAFGYDPRKHPESRIYQRMYFRNQNHPIERVSVMSRRQDRTTENAQIRAANQWNMENDAERKISHTFDGQTLTKDTAAFQLCDITDPLLKGMIEDPSVTRETCHEKDGWFASSALERIKNILRHKFFALLEGYIATDEECLVICNDKEQHKAIPTTKTLRTSLTKHNRAKGAQRPEELAVCGFSTMTFEYQVYWDHRRFDSGQHCRRKTRQVPYHPRRIAMASQIVT
jgi:general transcription factor 3C polypeptide 5 (transcription factor C subunit 1)